MKTLTKRQIIGLQNILDDGCKIDIDEDGHYKLSGEHGCLNYDKETEEYYVAQYGKKYTVEETLYSVYKVTLHVQTPYELDRMTYKLDEAIGLYEFLVKAHPEDAIQLWDSTYEETVKSHNY